MEEHSMEEHSMEEHSMEEHSSKIQLFISNIDIENTQKTTILDGDQVVISTESSFQNIVFEQHHSTNAIKIGSRLDEYGREIECILVYMTEFEFSCINDPINRQHSFVLKKQMDDEPPLLPIPLIRNQPSIEKIYFTEARFRELTLGTIEDGLPLVAPSYVRTSNT
jgi:hypothetical protein